MSSPKTKLRTVADVISRLKWSSDNDDASTIVLGYDDRIHGPMEKALQDYKPIKDGGDIPEHRIWYVRRMIETTIDEAVLWDRLGRVDRVFGSGNGGQVAISPETLDHVASAIQTMDRLDIEKKERRALKDKQRALKAKKRAAKAAALNYLAANSSKTEGSNGATTKPVMRYKWKTTPWYIYSNEIQQWKAGSASDDEPSSVTTLTSSESPRRQGNELTIITWNVLFDLYDNELQDHEERWSLIGTILESHHADVIALQEATPAFVSILLSQSWVKQNYGCTASPAHTDTVDSSGNLLLWRKDALVPLDGGVFVCVDSFRQCSLLACLEQVDESETSPILLVTNVHLLANKANASDSGSRALARRRELAAVIGQLQKVEQNVVRTGRAAQPLIVGDFNTSDENDSVFCGSENTFIDVWPMLMLDEPGYTFDPTCNVRAARTQSLTKSSGGSKRLDRMYLAKRLTKVEKDDLLLQPVAVDMVGSVDTGIIGGDETPPSDHFGLKGLFQTREFNQSDTERPTSCLRYPGFTAWAANAGSSPDTLLALVLDESELLGPDLFNKTSTLPVPHITLLHGFVELSSGGSCDFAIHAIRDAIDSVQDASEANWALRFDESSLDVFEHRSSATLIARPDIRHPTMQWLMQLYKTLTTTFQQCHEQESRFDEGYSPHVSLGMFGTAFAARAEASKRIEDDRWVKGDIAIPVYALTIFERSYIDGKFYAIASVPFKRSFNCNVSASLKPFLHDACASLTCNFKGQCSGVLLEIQRACQDVAGDAVHATLSIYGSLAIDAALPQFSDVDAVIELSAVGAKAVPFSSDESGTSYLGEVANRIKSRYDSAKCRVRTAAVAGGLTLSILTVKLWNTSPMVDLVLCRRFSDGQPMDEQSMIALEGVNLTAVVRKELLRACLRRDIDVERIFAGALRLVKLWAFQRGVYGGSTGFLGGGAWAVLLAHAMIQGLQDSTLSFSSLVEDTMSQASIRVVKHFFESSNRWSLPVSISLSHEESCDGGSGRPMTIMASPATGYLGRSTTMPTALVIFIELKRAASLLVSADISLTSQMASVLEILSLADFLSMFQTVLLIEMSTSKDPTSDFAVADAKAWTCRQVLHLTTELERVLDASKIRPRPIPVRIARGTFVWLIGLQTPSSRELHNFVDPKRSSIQQDWSSTFPLASSRESLPSIEAKSAVEAEEYLSTLGVNIAKQ